MTAVEKSPEQQNDLELKSLKLEQKKLSRRIGQGKKNGDDVTQLLAEIQDISTRIKALESEGKIKRPAGVVTAAPDINCITAPAADECASVHIDFALEPIKRSDRAVELDGDQIQIEAFNVFGQDEQAIEAYLQAHPGSTPYHRPCVLRAVQTSLGHDTRLFVAKHGGQIVGLLPVVQLNSKLFGNYCVSMPFFNYGGVLADALPVAQKLLSAAKHWAQQCEARHVEYRYCGDANFNLPSKSDKVSFYLALPNSVKALRAGFKSKLRSQIKKAESYAHEVRHGGTELIDDFYRVFSVNMRDLGTPVYGKNFFQALAHALGKQLSICVVYYDKKPAAAAIVIGHKDRLEIPWASTIRRYNPKSVNMLLYWQVLSWAVDNGYRSFDFGRCSTDAGTYKFKAQWGAVEMPLQWDYHLLAGEMPALNTKNKKFMLLIAIWKRLPVVVANLLGPNIVKYLP